MDRVVAVKEINQDGIFIAKDTICKLIQSLELDYAVIQTANEQRVVVHWNDIRIVE